MNLTREEMIARIQQLEAQLRKPTRVERISAAEREACKLAKDAEKARRRQFRLEAWKRARLHLSLNRYAMR